jgi:FkbM family methyltransferase
MRYNRLMLFRDITGCTVLEELKLPFFVLDAYLGLKTGFKTNPISKMFKEIRVNAKWMHNSRFVIRSGTFMFVSILPYREPATYEFVEHNLRKGDTFIDVGANIGAYAIPVAKIVGSKGRVIAIEPSPAKEFLKKNIELNGLKNVKVIEKAAYKRNTSLNFYYRPTVTTRSSIIPDWEMGEKHRMKVPATTLDDALRGIRKIKILKIDVEGAEVETLIGAKETLKKAKYVIFETEPDKLAECIELLRGFSKFYLLERIRGEKTANYLAARRSNTKVSSELAALRNLTN